MKNVQQARTLIIGTIAVLGFLYAATAYFFLGYQAPKVREQAREKIPQELPIEAQLCAKGTCRDISLAKTQSQQSIGLMGRESMPTNQGMLFVFKKPDTWSFWMKDTLLPLDIIRLDETFLVVDMATLEACNSTPCPRATPQNKAKYVLEINAGQAQFYNIEIGSIFDYTGPEL